ncbi:glycosyltransferase family 4 protein [Neorhodopirellula pilleata]|uniref:Putative glycosyl transferase n=1 Tax=Neorhodopirellula pilleata TaxID=2714738 RepID=A0A5C6AQH7_9BACT|nr:glycosyltransferase family 4 protein [Neorhodopirellula pilleata]TWU01808.1 putative glycosyl transferase [Neorhodopirellula pilleata]
MLQDLCEHLAAAGHDVHVVCGQPNSPRVGAEFVAQGQQEHHGVTIHRLGHSQFKKRFPAGRLLNLLSFTRATKRYLQRSRLKADVYVCETDPFLLPPVVANHAKLRGGRFIAYLQDIYPDVAEAIGKAQPGLVTRLIRTRLQSAYQLADQIIVLGSCMKDRLTAAPWSLDPDRICIIPNWADCEKIKPIDHRDNTLRRDWGVEERFVVMHSGNMGLTQRLDVLIKATADPAWPDHAILLLIGDGAAKEHLQQLAANGNVHDSSNLLSQENSSNKSLADESSRMSKVRFLSYQPREKLAESLSAADLHVVSMHENITGCLCPSKLYGILAAGRPVLAISPESTDLARTTRHYQVGEVCRPGDAAAIAHQVATFAKQNRTETELQQQAARKLALSHYDRPVCLRQLTQQLVAENSAT